jgi:hypothetical protein
MIYKNLCFNKIAQQNYRSYNLKHFSLNNRQLKMNLLPISNYINLYKFIYDLEKVKQLSVGHLKCSLI